MRINVTDRARIFAKQLQGKNGAYTSYSTSLGKKNQDGTWDNGRLFVEFQKGNPVPENIGEKGVDIDIVDGWLTFRNYTPTVEGRPMVDRNGRPVTRTAFGVHIKQWRYPQGQNAPQTAPQTAPQAAQIPDSFAVVDEDEPW